MKKILTILISSLLLITINSHGQATAKYVFLFIGDGMGVNQVYTTELYKASLDGKIASYPLSFSYFPVQSFMTTYSADNYITCSSASGTAIASGYKTKNGVINMDTSLTIKYETIAEKAQKAGYKVGIVSSAAVDHATPACFYAHKKSRYLYDDIAMELFKSNFDYFGGGGFHNSSMIDTANKYEYSYFNTKKEFSKLKKGDEKVIAVNPGTYSGKEYYWEIDKRVESVPLSYFTKKGIELLDNDKGFFMMVEGGKIDWSLHSNDAATTIHEILAFDDAVKEALKFYEKHKDETLIIVTADHETGGMGLGNNTIFDKLNLKVLQHQKISHQEFERKIKNLKKQKREVSFSEVLDSVKSNFGLGDKEKGLALTDDEKSWLFEAYNKQFLGKKEAKPDKDYLNYDFDIPLTYRAIKILNSKAGIAWTTVEHTASQVPVSVIGGGQEYFKSSIDNTDIAKIIMKVMQLNQDKK
ncbi:MAG: alkaline phosphatase [Bacteroidota bacterium]